MFVFIIITANMMYKLLINLYCLCYKKKILWFFLLAYLKTKQNKSGIKKKKKISQIDVGKKKKKKLISINNL